MRLENYLKLIQKNLQKGSERSHYPALKSLLDDPNRGIDAVIEEKGNKAGIPDFTVKRRELLIGYIEAKEIGSDLNQVEKTEQLKRYLEAFSNLILTNYLEFRWYVNGQCRLKEILANFYATNDNKIEIKNVEKVTTLLDQFLNYTGEIINNPEDLARQMARLAKSIRLATISALETEHKNSELRQLKTGFSEVLLPDLSDADFSDMYAQTIAYGLFAARVGHVQHPESDPFTRRTASTYIPATNPFLKRLFNTLVETDIISKIDWAIDDLVQLLSQVNMGNILENFGWRTRKEDPIVHFYETFLATYNATLRKSRGVYYTPEPIVSFIVRSVDTILKTQFNLPLGLADNTKDPITQKSIVQILDPATGTGTFLYEVIQQIYNNLEEIGMVNQWNTYVNDNLLYRMFGFELLMAPYAIAHLKLGLQLQELGYQFQSKQRLGIYLTNTLDEALKKSEVLFGQFVAQEANEASVIKKDIPVMVVLGNPPYSGHSANKSKWIANLIKDYYSVNGVPLGEKNSKYLQDDYVKFIRFGQWRIEQTGAGILAFITNNGYLDNPTFRGMRQNLIQAFTDIYILDLHGNSKKKEVSPDGSPDQNVFDIQQGVSIGIFIKESGKRSPARVHHAELWGDRKSKYEKLKQSNFDDINWRIIEPQPSFYFFYPQNIELFSEYSKGWKITDIMPLHSVGVKTHRDHFLVGFDFLELKNRMENFRNPNISDQEISSRYQLQSNDGWNLKLKRNHVINDIQWEQKIQKCLYRPFDFRFYYYDPYLLERPRIEVMQHMLSENIGLITTRQTKEKWDLKVSNVLAEGINLRRKLPYGADPSLQGFQPIYQSILFRLTLVALADNKSLASYDTNSFFPLYKYPKFQDLQGTFFADRSPNISSGFMAVMQQNLGYIPTPENIFYYIYALLHSCVYRKCYAQFLKIDFPRVPLITNDQLFKDLCIKGKELVDLHLMKSPKLNTLMTKMGGLGDNAVTKVAYKLTEQRVYINENRYFEGIPSDIWTFKVGGYQVLDKWLKDRKKAKRILSFDDVLHYQKIVVSLNEAIKTTIEIDRLIPDLSRLKG